MIEKKHTCIAISIRYVTHLKTKMIFFNFSKIFVSLREGKKSNTKALIIIICSKISETKHNFSKPRKMSSDIFLTFSEMLD